MTRPLTILKVTDAWDFIAEADNLLVMSRELAKLGHRVVIACARNSGLADRGAREGFDVRIVPGMDQRKNPIAFLRAAMACRRLAAEIRPDVVHAYRSPPHLMALWAVRGTKMPVVRTRATMVPPRPTAMNRRIQAATARTLVSADIVMLLCIQAGFDPTSLAVIPGGLDLARFDPAKHDRAKAKAALGVPEGALVVGHLARLAPVKGHVHLIAAMKDVIANVPNAHLVLVGAPVGGLDESIRGWAREHGIADRVTITGAVEDVPQALAAFDVGIVSSIGSEAFSRAALEYFAMGLPVVATRVGTLPELVDDGKTGRLVAPKDEAAMAAAITELLRDETLRKTWGAAAREAAVSRFGAEAQAAKLDAVYRDIVRS